MSWLDDRRPPKIIILQCRPTLETLAVKIYLYRISITPANTKHLYSICTTSAQRLRRWANIVQMLYKCFVFAGIILVT